MSTNPKISRRKAKRTIHAVDLFCGAGGTSSGLIGAVNSLGYAIKLTAINHWDIAIATHSKNHEDVTHHCQSIETINPTEIVPGGRLHLLVASPECTHHSRARGGKPRSDQKRADAWLLMRWIEKLYVENILIENVKEFVEWGPLTKAGKPDKRHKGKYFRAFVDQLKINYNVEYRVLNCADYGDPTTRERFFLIARRPRHKPIVWPTRTHASRKELAKIAAQPDLSGELPDLKPWVAAREIIDWSLEGKSIFGRKKPLSPNTMRRIFAGLQKYSLKPFIVPQNSTPDTRDVDRPVPTVTTTSRGIRLIETEAFMLSQASGGAARQVDEPVPTIPGKGAHSIVETEAFQLNLKGTTRRDRSIDEPTFTQAGGNNQGVVEVEQLDPFLIKNFGDESEAKYRAKSLDEPLGTVCAQRNHHGLVEVEQVDAFTISAGGPQLEAKSVDDPLRTVLTRDHQAIVESFIFNMAHSTEGHARRCKSLDDPLQTIAGKGTFGKIDVDPYIVNMKGQSNARSVDDPTFTQTKKTHQYLAEPSLVPYIVPFFGERDGQEPRTRDIDEPAPTVTTHGRMALAQPFIVQFNTKDRMLRSVDDPLGTVATKDRFGLCIPEYGVVLDIRFRMLQPHELAAAMSFEPDYEFVGNREQKVKQIGNAVPRRTAKALCQVLLEDVK